MNQPKQKTEYTVGDYDRLGTIKKASDLVFIYFNWALSDHRRTLNEKDHQKVIVQLITDVGSVFGVGDEKEALVRYFIVNVIEACQEIERLSMPKAWMPFSLDALTSMFEPSNVSAAMVHLNIQNQFMWAGRLFPESHAEHHQSDEICLGHIVGADLILVQTASWELLLQGIDMEDDGSFECVGKALAKGQETFLDFLGSL